jgi:hypothetical protein
LTSSATIRNSGASTISPVTAPTTSTTRLTVLRLGIVSTVLLPVPVTRSSIRMLPRVMGAWRMRLIGLRFLVPGRLGAGHQKD